MGFLRDDWFTLRWHSNALEILDQRLLPGHESYLRLVTVEQVAHAIEDLAVRGAPAIGCAAAFGMACAAQQSSSSSLPALSQDLEDARERLSRTRPTAANLFWALAQVGERIQATIQRKGDPDDLRAVVLEEAQRILDNDVVCCRSIGKHGLSVVPERARIQTHCNAGALATGGYGTALGVVRAAAAARRDVSVFVGETRPFLQGARLTAWELARDDIPVTVMTDGMTGHLMSCGEIDLVIVGADRIAANGDVANKIGTYMIAVLAERHGIPFYVAAPYSTLDLSVRNGKDIPIEERGRAEMAVLGNQEIIPDGVPVRHPAFDITPAGLVSGIITECGIVRPPYPTNLRALVKSYDAKS